MSHAVQRKEKFTSVQKVQAGVTKLLLDADAHGAYYRVMRNNEPIGVLLSNDAWEEILEDIEALSSQSFHDSLEISRKSKALYTFDQIKDKYKLR